MTVPSLFGDSDSHESPPPYLRRRASRRAQAPAPHRRRRCIASIDLSRSTAMSWSVKSTSSVHCRTPSDSTESLMRTSSAALAAQGKPPRLGCSPKRSIVCTTIQACALQCVPELPSH